MKLKICKMCDMPFTFYSLLIYKETSNLVGFSKYTLDFKRQFEYAFNFKICLQNYPSDFYFFY